MITYCEYKESGTPWLGEVPSHWRIERAKWHFSIRNERGNAEPVLLAATQKNGMYPQEKVDGVVKVADGTDIQQFKTVHKGDFVISLRSFQGGFERSDFEGVCSPAYQVFFADQTVWDNDYLKFLFKDVHFVDAMNALTVGIREGRNIKFEDFANSLIAIPPRVEQLAIAEHLTARTQQIDAIISEAKASIEEYKAWKASIIYEAVTKGLDPKAEMVANGSKWIPETPVGTKVSRVGLHYDIVLGKMLCPDQVDKTYTLEPYFCAANVHFSGVETGNLKEMWFNPKEKELYKVELGDLLVVEGGAGAGGSAIVQECNRETYIQNSIMIVRGRRGNNNGFLKYVLESLVGRGYVDFACNKATIPHFTKEKLGNTPYPVFAPDDQIRITTYLDEQCGSINALISEKEALISDLEAYKKSLIFEVVTGKRKVC